MSVLSGGDKSHSSRLDYDFAMFRLDFALQANQTMAGLKAEGWTDGLIKKHLGEPDETAPNPHYSQAGAPMRLYTDHAVSGLLLEECHPWYESRVAALITWLNQNWFTLVQSIGIIGSLWLAGAAYRRDVKARRVGDLLTLASQHRELWSDAHRRPELGRIFGADVDVLAEPITLAEEEFLNAVIVHFYTSWLLVKEGALLTMEALALDARDFFSLPVPRSVWERTKQGRDNEFVRFIEKALARPRRK